MPYIVLEDFPVQQLCAFAARCKALVRLANVASARGCKRDDRLAGQVIAFKKCIDNRRRDIPPALKSNPIIEGTLMFHTTFQQYSPFTRYKG